MGHYAKVQNGKVVKVIVAEASFFNNFVDDSPGKWIKTSYNTRGGVHYEPNSDTPSPTIYQDVSGSVFSTLEDANNLGTGSITTIDQSQTLALRGNYAGIGYTYDSTHDAFYAPQPYNSWTLNTGSFLWESPVEYPTDGNVYNWDEETTSWVSQSLE